MSRTAPDWALGSVLELLPFLSWELGGLQFSRTTRRPTSVTSIATTLGTVCPVWRPPIGCSPRGGKRSRTRTRPQCSGWLSLQHNNGAAVWRIGSVTRPWRSSNRVPTSPVGAINPSGRCGVGSFFRTSPHTSTDLNPRPSESASVAGSSVNGLSASTWRTACLPDATWSFGSRNTTTTEVAVPRSSSSCVGPEVAAPPCGG